MEKYICPNCGFKRGFRTQKDGDARYCKNCGTQVYTSKVVLASMMRIHVLSNK